MQNTLRVKYSILRTQIIFDAIKISWHNSKKLISHNEVNLIKLYSGTSKSLIFIFYFLSCIDDLSKRPKERPRKANLRPFVKPAREIKISNSQTEDKTWKHFQHQRKRKIPSFEYPYHPRIIKNNHQKSSLSLLNQTEKLVAIRKKASKKVEKK